MQRVTGIGGVFIKAKDPAALRAWYRTHLGIDVQPWGGFAFPWHRPGAPEPNGVTVWNVFPADCTYFAPSTAPFMVNYRVSDLQAVLQALKDEGCAVEEEAAWLRAACNLTLYRDFLLCQAALVLIDDELDVC